MSALTETERASLRAICDDGRQFDELAHEVRAIIDARLAPVLALADEWQRVGDERDTVFSDLLDARECAAALRVAAGTPTPLFGICPDCNVAGGHYPTCPARTPTHHTTEEDT